MKVKKFNEELRKLSFEQLVERLGQFQRELFSLRLNAATAHVKDYSQFTHLRRDIARIQTHIAQQYRAQVLASIFGK